LQEERVTAFREFADDVQTGAYPAPQHLVAGDPEVTAAFALWLADQPLDPV
jgi:3-methyl-2-oxobutanoate hydroxymethyltransferase